MKTIFRSAMLSLLIVSAGPVVAAGDVTVLVVTRDALERELDHSTWMRSFVGALTRRFVDLDGRVMRLEEELAGYRGKEE